MPLIILTRPPAASILKLDTWRNIAKRILGKKRGPQAVISSVIRGLNNKGFEFKLDPTAKNIPADSTIWVNQSIEALEWALEFKLKNKGAKIIAGPNLVVTPDEHNSIIFDKNIDTIIQPSEWTREFYESYSRDIGSKIKIWPAGVEDPYLNINVINKVGYFIVYQKNAPKELFDKVIAKLNNDNINFKIVKYGKFKHEDFLKMLVDASGMVYLSQSESQGIALQEAWIRDVPTLVWDRGYWQVGKNKFEHVQISCPYLNNECGETFNDAYAFDNKFESFIKNLPNFRARKYCLANLSDEVTTGKFLDIIGL